MTRRNLLLLLLVVVLLAAAAVLTVWRPNASPATSSEPLPAPALLAVADSVVFEDFVGSERCVECHATQVAAWRGSTHAAAGGAPGAVRLIAPFDGTPIRFSDAEVIPRSAGGRVTFTVRRSGMDDRVFTVDAVVGGGHMEGGGTQGFVAHYPDGTYRFLPFDFSRHGASWFCNTIARGNRGWVPITTALSITDCVDWPPARVLGEEPRFSNCQSCHGSQILLALDTAAHAYRTRFRSLDVNCEACHGPARKHLALVRDTAAAARGDVGMAPLATLGKDASLGTCWRCHALKDQLRPGFLPGLPLERYYSTRLPQLGDAAHFPDGRVRTFGYQEGHLFADCYLNGGLTCTNCHDPHSQGYRDVTGQALAGRIDDRQCTACHASKADSASTHTRHRAGSPGSACVSCHMPYLQQPELGQAVRYARSDHSIPIPRPAFDAALGITSACRGCHTDRAEAVLDQQVKAWYGAVKPQPEAVTALVRSQAVPDEEPLAAARRLLVPDATHTAALFAGMAWFVDRHLPPDMEALAGDITSRLRFLARHPDADVRALALASLHYARGSNASVRSFLAAELRALGTEEALVRWRWALVLGYLGDRLREKGNPLAAIETYRKAREIDPLNPRIPVNLALAYVGAGNLSGAIDAYRQSLTLDPAQPLALVNYGNALAKRGELSSAEEMFRRVLALNPREPLGHFNLGGVFVQQRRTDSALVAFRRAAELDPSLALARFYVARIYLERGDRAAALREIEAGLEFDPQNAEARAMRERLVRAQSR